MLRLPDRLPAWLPLAAAALGLAAGAAATWVIQDWRHGAALAECRAGAAQARAGAAETAIDELQASVQAIAAAASGVAAAGQRAALATDAARRRWQVEVAARPLPPDCRRDEARQRALREAIGRVQEAR